MAKDKEIKVAAATYNILDPDQKEEWEFVYSHTNVSAYLKRLVRRDMESKMPTPRMVPAPKEEGGIDELQALL
jgi:hypothetical protein